MSVSKCKKDFRELSKYFLNNLDIYKITQYKYFFDIPDASKHINIKTIKF